MSRNPTTRMLRAVGLATCFAILIWHSLQYNFVTDDAYISFVFSENFAKHGQLVFNPGQTPVEGYTNFLWTLILGLFMVVGLPPTVVSLVLGTTFALATLFLVARLTARLLEGAPGKPTGQWPLLPSAFLALSSGFACWSSGGLETQMFTFFVTLALYLYLRASEEPRYYGWLGVCLALGAMTRPEGLLVAGVLGMHRVACKIFGERSVRISREEWHCVLFFLCIWGPWFAWRVWYYGHLFPNTYYVKAAGPASDGYAASMSANGRYYVWQWLTQSKLLYVSPLVCIGLLAAKPRTPRFVYGTAAFLLFVVYVGYAIRVGGDFMGLHRFVMPLFVIGAVGCALGIWRVAQLALRGKWGTWCSLGIALGILGVFGYSQFRLTQKSVAWGNWQSDHGIDTPSYLAVYAHDRKRIGEHMRDCFVEDDMSIFGGVGAKPFAAKAKGVDVFGLVSDVVAHEVPRTRPRAGHNKWAPAKLLFDTYKPDFVFHCYSLHRDPKRPAINCSHSEQQFWKRHGYEFVTLHIPGLKERGEYYTFFVHKERSASFRATCPGLVQ